MYTYLVVAVAVIIVLAIVGLLVSRTRRPDEVDRFLRAREMTSAWSRGEPTPRPGRFADLSEERLLAQTQDAQSVVDLTDQSPIERQARARNSAT